MPPKIQQKVLNAFENAGKKLAGRVHNTYGELTGNWKMDGQRPIDTPVIFVERVSRKPGRILVEVKTDSLKYRYVDLGTEPHPISPRPSNKSGMLVFGSTFKARTKPGVLRTGDGGKSGMTVFTPYVKHPGIKEPRNFEATIDKEQIPLIKEDLRETFKILTPLLFKVEKYG